MELARRGFDGFDGEDALRVELGVGTPDEDAGLGDHLIPGLALRELPAETFQQQAERFRRAREISEAMIVNGEFNPV